MTVRDAASLENQPVGVISAGVRFSRSSTPVLLLLSQDSGNPCPRCRPSTPNQHVVLVLSKVFLLLAVTQAGPNPMCEGENTHKGVWFR